MNVNQGWYGESYRHSLAARGFASKKSKIISELYGVPSQVDIESMRKKTSDDFYDVNLEIDELDKLPEYGEADVLVPLTKKTVVNMEELEALIEAKRKRREAKRLFESEFNTNFVSKDEFSDRYEHYHKFMGLDDFDTKRALMSEFSLSPSDVEEELQELGYRHSLAARGIRTSFKNKLSFIDIPVVEISDVEKKIQKEIELNNLRELHRRVVEERERELDKRLAEEGELDVQKIVNKHLSRQKKKSNDLWPVSKKILNELDNPEVEVDNLEISKGEEE